MTTDNNTIATITITKDSISLLWGTDPKTKDVAQILTDALHVARSVARINQDMLVGVTDLLTGGASETKQ